MAGDGTESPGAPSNSPDRRPNTPSDSVDERQSFYDPPSEDGDMQNEPRRRQSEEVPLDFSIKKPDSDEEDDADSNASAEHSLGPPPLLKRDQVSVDFSNYKPGPAVFPHMNKPSFSPPMPKTESCVSPRQAVKKEKIGEPQTASPGMIPGVAMSAAAQMHGLLPGFPPGGFLSQSGLLNAALPFLGLDPRAANAAAQLAMKQQQQHQGKNGSTPRPFKTYPKDPLSLPLGVYNMPEMPPGVSPVDVAAANAMSANSEQLFSHYKHMVRQMQGDLSPGNRRANQQKAVKERRSSDGSTSSQVSSTSAHSEQGSPAIPSHAPSGFSPPGGPGGQMPYPQTPSPKSSSGGSRKRPRTIPEELKDIAYWERRRKNNEAAKRSRDARRAKEDEIAIRAAFLEQENLKLRVEVAALKNETSKLRCMLYNS